jgi:ribulose-phosphate 3-epimerase
MITPADPFLEAFREAGADIMSVHPEAGPHLNRTIKRIRQLGAKAGVVFNPSTSIDAIRYMMDDVDLVLVMSVNPGFGGQAFIAHALAKIAAIRQRIDAHVAAGGRPIALEVDGGVKVDNIRAVADAGADTFVAGSAIFGARDPDGGFHGVMATLRRELAASTRREWAA